MRATGGGSRARGPAGERAHPSPGGPGVLYVVATPIGNLEDVTLRALRVLGEVELIAAEDTRRTRTLLARHDIRTPLVSYYDRVERKRAPRLVARLRAGAHLALVSDAGTPGLSDPGYRLVTAALAAGVRVVPVPGPSALTAVLSVAGVPAGRFAFEGFLPTRGGARRRRLAALAGEPRAVVLFESGRRLAGTLADLEAVLGGGTVGVAREVTKLHEEFLRGSIGEVRARIDAAGEVRGEVTLVVSGREGESPRAEEDAETCLRELAARGMSGRDLARALARACNVPHREAYRRVLDLRARGPGSA